MAFFLTSECPVDKLIYCSLMDAEIDRSLEGLSDEDDAQTSALQNSHSEVKTGIDASKISRTVSDDEYPDLGTIDMKIDAQFRSLQGLYEPRASVMKDGRLNVEQYIKLVRLLGNEPVNFPAIEPEIRDSLGKMHSLSLSIHYSTHDIPILPENTFNEVTATCETSLELLQCKRALLSHLQQEVEQKMPNIAMLISTPVAAELIAKVGGLRSLSLVSPSNSVNPRTSVLIKEPIIREVPDRYKRPALRILATKSILAARLDQSRSSSSHTGNSEGALPSTLTWKRNIRQRIDKLSAPPPSLQQRSLPKPVNKATSRRGGQKSKKRRQRRAEKMGQAEIVKFGT